MWRTSSLVLAIVLMAYAAAAWLTRDFRVWTAEGERRLTIAQSPVAAPDIVMLTIEGNEVRLPEMLRSSDAVTIVNFIYTRCPTVCLAMGSTFQQIQKVVAEDKNSAASRIQLLSISFDVNHDSPAVLTAFGESQLADPQRWKFIVPAKPVDLQLLLKSFGVVVIPDGFGGYEHNAGLLVIDRSGRLVRIFDPTDVDRAITTARRLAVGSTLG